MDKKEFIRAVPLGPIENVATFKILPGYNRYHQLCAASAFHTWDEDYPLVQVPAMASVDEDTQPTVRSKYKPIDRTFTGHTTSVQLSKISDDEDTSDTPD